MDKRIAIVTGASSGLGAEFVKQLDEHEKLDEIWVIARRRERMAALQEEVHTPLRVFAWDLTEPETFSGFSELLASEKPHIMFLVNAAGYGKIGSFRDISPEENERMVDLNCRAAMSVTQRSIPYMGKGSRVLEICSTAAFQPMQYLDTYAATKAFLYRYSRALRIELLGTGIHVTAVCPYWIKDTEFIGVAQKTKNSRYIRHFPLGSKKHSVAAMALCASRLNLPVATPGIICTLHRIVAKFIPHSLMMGVWALIRRI
ncbi:MAG TPA: SDR family NAD(P)-dependent oxidoreductase [Lachnospiraceae bacterium]|nr:SDR family NAD(P)-dependent oxidoreductase [Lachnospiraceae bacterium]